MVCDAIVFSANDAGLRHQPGNQQQSQPRPQQFRNNPEIVPTTRNNWLALLNGAAALPVPRSASSAPSTGPNGSASGGSNSNRGPSTWRPGGIGYQPTPPPPLESSNSNYLSQLNGNFVHPRDRLTALRSRILGVANGHLPAETLQPAAEENIPTFVFSNDTPGVDMNPHQATLPNPHRQAGSRLVAPNQIPPRDNLLLTFQNMQHIPPANMELSNSEWQVPGAAGNDDLQPLLENPISRLQRIQRRIAELQRRQQQQVQSYHNSQNLSSSDIQVHAGQQSSQSSMQVRLNNFLSFADEGPARVSSALPERNQSSNIGQPLQQLLSYPPTSTLRQINTTNSSVTPPPHDDGEEDIQLQTMPLSPNGDLDSDQEFESVLDRLRPPATRHTQPPLITYRRSSGRRPEPGAPSTVPRLTIDEFQPSWSPVILGQVPDDSQNTNSTARPGGRNGRETVRSGVFTALMRRRHLRRMLLLDHQSDAEDELITPSSIHSIDRPFC